MGFSNSVVGGITLVRPAIRSPNYVTGVSGWTINIDGSAEFFNAVIRGDLQAGGVAPNARMEFADTTHIPADLQAFYGGTIVAALLFWFNNAGTGYSFIATSNTDALYYGTSSSGTVREAFRFTGAVANMWRVPAGGGLQFATGANGPTVSSDGGGTVLRLGAAGGFAYGLNDGAGFTQGYHYADTLTYTAASTAFTKASYPGLRMVISESIGDGGGGGGCALTAAGQVAVGAGGGGGGYALAQTLVGALAASETVTVGQGGAGGTAGANAGAAGTGSSFGAFSAAAGGGGGAGSASTAANGNSQGGSGGNGTAGLYVAAGSDGMNGTYGNGFYAQQGSGGASALGFGGATRGNATDAGGAGIAGAVFGGGGSGGHNAAGVGTARAGGAGGPGLVLVHLYV